MYFLKLIWGKMIESSASRHLNELFQKMSDWETIYGTVRPDEANGFLQGQG